MLNLIKNLILVSLFSIFIFNPLLSYNKKILNKYEDKHKYIEYISITHELYNISLAMNIFKLLNKKDISENSFIEDLIEADYLKHTAGSMVGNYHYDSNSQKITYNNNIDCLKIKNYSENIHFEDKNFVCNNNKLSIYLN